MIILKKVSTFYFCTVIMFLFLFLLPYILTGLLGLGWPLTGILHWIYAVGLMVMVFFALAVRQGKEKVEFSFRKRLYLLFSTELALLIICHFVFALNYAPHY